MKNILAIIFFFFPILLDAQKADSLNKTPAYAEVIRLNRCAGKYAQSVFYCQTKEKKIISIDSVSDFLRIVKNPANYNQGVAACHDPGIGVIIYNKDKRPVSWYSLCMACNNVYSEPKMKAARDYERSGFSKQSRNKLRKIFKQWGFNYIGASEMFDSKKDFERLQKEVEAGKGYN